MLTTPRRITLYWLLLLLPTLAVGTGALVLVRREQARLDEQARIALESRRAAIEARARLIVENVELLIGDVQAGLMATLREIPATDPDSALEEWERTNPLVRATFRVTRSGELLRPAADAAPADVREALSSWRRSTLQGASVVDQKELVLREQDEVKRRSVSSNVAQVQAARSALQDVANRRMEKQTEASSAEADVTGWSPWRHGPQLQLIGWQQRASGELIGVFVELSVIESRFAELLPTASDFEATFALHDAQRARSQPRSYREAGFSSREAFVAIPVSAEVLPGWHVEGYLRDPDAKRVVGGGFFLVGSLLVGAFVAAILSGGSLLLWQARRSEAEAAQKTSFVANVSHEFKTPLTTIRLYAELLEQGRVRDTAQSHEFLNTIARETQRLARLVNNALDFSRLEQGRRSYARETLDLAAALARLLDTHAPRLGEAGLTLERVIPTEPITVATDRDAVEQIVLNLLDNACKYAVDGGEATVTLGPKPDGGAEIHVADRGPGVPPAHRERIFEKFHRVDDALTAEKSGAGLGLSIARQLARGVGGELRYRPRAGGGAEFVLELP